MISRTLAAKLNSAQLAFSPGALFTMYNTVAYMQCKGFVCVHSDEMFHLQKSGATMP